MGGPSLKKGLESRGVGKAGLSQLNGVSLLILSMRRVLERGSEKPVPVHTKAGGRMTPTAQVPDYVQQKRSLGN